MKKDDFTKDLPKFRNLRDVSQYSKPIIKSNMLFRSSDLSAYENDPLLRNWSDDQGIKTIIDLRNIIDINKRTYSPKILKNIMYRNIKLVSDEIGYITVEEQLREKISGIYGAISRFEGAPTESQIKRLAYLEKEIEQIELDLKKVIDTTIPELNKELSNLNIEPIIVISYEDYLKEFENN